MSEKLVQQLHAQGIDPLKIPRFSALRLTEETSPLASQLTQAVGHTADLPDLLWERLQTVTAQPGLSGKLPRMVEFFGAAALAGQTSFGLLDICNALGIDCFEGHRISFEAFRLRPLFRTAGADDRVAFTHLAYQEILAAEHLRDPAARHAAVGGRLTEQIRAFLHHRSQTGPSAGSDDCVLAAGTYLVGPSHHLMLRQVERPVRFDRYAVTVERYNRFLEAVARGGAERWEHPGQPQISHQPWVDRLRVPDYYTDPAYAQHPAICVSWWSAYAFAAFEGKRLPTSLEWEAAARGTDGRLFPWGDGIDTGALNCADSYADRPLVTYEAWLAEHDRGRLREAFPRPVDAHQRNRSPIGVRQMAGNVWEFTSTVLGDRGEAVICGGSFDNPAKAVQTSSKGLARQRVSSNAIGFRCVEDL